MDRRPPSRADAAGHFWHVAASGWLGVLSRLQHVEELGYSGARECRHMHVVVRACLAGRDGISRALARLPASCADGAVNMRAFNILLLLAVFVLLATNAGARHRRAPPCSLLAPGLSFSCVSLPAGGVWKRKRSKKSSDQASKDAKKSKRRLRDTGWKVHVNVHRSFYSCRTHRTAPTHRTAQL